MSTTTDICKVISDVITNTPSLKMLDAGAIFVGLPSTNKKQCITIDGVYAIEAKNNMRGITIHLWMPLSAAKQAGDIHDIADALVVALKGSPILMSNWTHQPDSNNNVDHVVFPAEVYTDLL